MSGKFSVTGTSTASYATPILSEDNLRQPVNSTSSSTNPKVKTSGATIVKSGDTPYKLDWRVLYNAAFNSGLNANEAKNFADAHATGEIHWTSGDPTDDKKNGITGGDLKLLVGAKYAQNLSDAQIADLTNRVDDYAARGGKLFSRKDALPAATTNPNEQFAEKNNYDASSLLRSRLENQLPVPQPIPQPAPTPIKIDRIIPVSEMSSDEKIGAALIRMFPLLPASMIEKIEAMKTPEAISTLTAVLGAWAIGHYFGISEIIDALAIVGLVAMGVEVADIGQKLYEGAVLALNARTDEDLDRAAKKLADAVGGATVDIAAAKIANKTGALIQKGVNSLPKLPPPSPQLATPNGISFSSIARPSVLETRLPIWATPTTAPSTGLLSERLFGNQKPSDYVLESRANGFPNQRIPSSDGEWTGAVGESGWKSTKPEVISATGGKPIPYKKGFPDFSEWSKGEVKLSKMVGDYEVDFREADKLFAKQKKWFKPDGTPDRLRVKTLRETQGLTWHHHEDMTTMQLVPKDINNEVAHTGGASLVKRANKAVKTTKP